MRFDLACLALIGYLLLSVLVYVRTCVKGEFRISYGKLGPTEVRLIAVSGNTLVYIFGQASFQVFSWTLSLYDCIAIGVILLELSISIVTAITQAGVLAAQDPSPSHPGDPS